MGIRTEIANKANNLIAFVNWSGAPMEEKKQKIIRELAEIRKICRNTDYK